MSASSTLFLLVAVVGVMTAGGYVHYQRTQTQMRDQVCGVCVACDVMLFLSRLLDWCVEYNNRNKAADHTCSLKRAETSKEKQSMR